MEISSCLCPERSSLRFEQRSRRVACNDFKVPAQKCRWTFAIRAVPSLYTDKRCSKAAYNACGVNNKEPA